MVVKEWATLGWMLPRNNVAFGPWENFPDQASWVDWFKRAAVCHKTAHPIFIQVSIVDESVI